MSKPEEFVGIDSREGFSSMEEAAYYYLNGIEDDGWGTDEFFEEDDIDPCMDTEDFPYFDSEYEDAELFDGPF